MKVRKIIFRILRVGVSVVVVILILMLFLALGRRAYEFGYRIFTETSVDEEPGKDVVVLVRSDMSKRDVAEMLEEKGLVNDSWLFLIQYRLTDYKRIEPGTYTLNTSMTTHDMAAIMAGAEEDTEDTESTEETGGAEETDGSVPDGA